MSLRNACDMSRACMPIVAMPMSPSEFGFGHECRHGINHDHVEHWSGRGFRRWSRLLPGVRLRDEQIVQIHAGFLA